MNWLWLAFAGVLEVCWAVGLKYSNGFSRLLPSVFTLAAMILSFVLLALSMRSLPLGTAYAVWTGIGVIGTVLSGIIFFGESASLLRIACLSLIFVGIAGLRLLTEA